MELYTVIGICLIALFAAIFLKQYRPEFALAVTVIASVIALLLVGIGFSEIKSELKDVFGKIEMVDGLFSVVIKALGICYICEFASNLSKDFGQNSLAAKIELAGKISIMILTFPLIKQITETGLDLIG